MEFVKSYTYTSTDTLSPTGLKTEFSFKKVKLDKAA